MTATTTSVLATACLLASSLTHANCSPTFTERFSSAQRMVDSLRPDKPAQARVAAHTVTKRPPLRRYKELLIC
jgi:hypothetical protein